MDVVANYVAGEEVVGAFFSHESDNGKAPADDDEGPNRGPEKNNNKKHDRTSTRPSMTTSSLRLGARSLEAPRRGRSSTRCLRSPALPQGRGQPQT